MSEGFKRAGYNPVAHVEMSPEACRTIKTRVAYHYLKEEDKSDLYFDYIEGKLGSVAELDKAIPQHLLDSVINVKISDETINSVFAQIDTLLKEHDKKEIDLIIGGPPCQAYSLLGRHQENIYKDDRNFLYVQYGKFLEKYQPKAFVFENVLGLLSAKNGIHFENIRKYFNKRGYEFHYKVLNAADYGVLQLRKRIIIVGWKKELDLGFPEIPKIPRNWTVDDILCDLPFLTAGQSLTKSSYKNPASDYVKRFDIRNGAEFVTQNIARPHNTNDIEIYKFAINKWVNNQIRLKYNDLPESLKTHKNTQSFVDRFKVVNGAGLSHTVVAHIAKDGHHYIHPDISQSRSLTVREAARIQSFPDDFYFETSRTAAFTQIGNAVPPLMSYAIARKMKELLCQIK